VAVSHRRLMERASIGNPNTLINGLARLSEAGYVFKSTLSNGKPRLVGKANPRTRAHSYKLTLPGDQIVTGQNIKPGERGGDSLGMDKGVALTHRSGEGGNNRGVEKVSTGRSNHSVCNKENLVAKENGDSDPSLQILLDPSLDMWRYAALASARLTYGELLKGIASVDMIAQTLTKDPRTIKWHLKELMKVALAEKKLDGTWVAFERDPDDVAMELGTFAMGALQADRHTWESEKYVTYEALREKKRREMDERVFQELVDEGQQWTGFYKAILAPPLKNVE
jgi:DNA-binding transcriptional ArsR family regulator